MKRAADVLGYEEVVITNLCSVATPSIIGVNGLGHEAWTSARADLEVAVASGTGLLAAWGVGGLSGDARRRMCAQVEWLVDHATKGGLHSFWMVGGEPRHPSRWHQYVSDKYERTRGGSFEERLAQVLIDVPARVDGTGPRVESSARILSMRDRIRGVYDVGLSL